MEGLALAGVAGLVALILIGMLVRKAMSSAKYKERAKEAHRDDKVQVEMSRHRVALDREDLIRRHNARKLARDARVRNPNDDLDS